MPFRIANVLRECPGKSHLPRKGYLFAANVYLQDELRGVSTVALFAGNQVELLPLHKVALNLALEERDTSADENDSECGQNSHIPIDPLEAGILEEKILQRVHRVSEWIDDGKPSQPHGKSLCRGKCPGTKEKQGIEDDEDVTRPEMIAHPVLHQN